MNVAYRLETAYCDGCGRQMGPLGCCTAISQLRSLITMYEFTLKEISKTKTMTIRGDCCKANTCAQTPDGSACAYRAGANRAFQMNAQAADAVLTPEAKLS